MVSIPLICQKNGYLAVLFNDYNCDFKIRYYINGIKINQVLFKHIIIPSGEKGIVIKIDKCEELDLVITSCYSPHIAKFIYIDDSEN